MIYFVLYLIAAAIAYISSIVDGETVTTSIRRAVLWPVYYLALAIRASRVVYESTVPHIKYLRYVLRHKWFVFVAGWKLGVPLIQLITHDFSKFSREEWTPYVNHFYRDGDYLDDFFVAFCSHTKKNPHHWQYWSEGRESPEAIPDKYCLEMVADWAGAGKAINGEWDPAGWYEENKDKIKMHPASIAAVEYYMKELKS